MLKARSFHAVMLLLVMLALAACVGSGKSQGFSAPKLPYRTWEIGLITPNYMEVWVESVDVVDQRGFAYERVHGGTSSIQNPPGNRGNPSGWPKRPGAGKSRPMEGIDLPEHIFVRWQSLAEPQTYNARVDVPDWVRHEMIIPRDAYCRFDGKNIQDYRKVITLGLAPGGIVKAWLNGDCSDPMEIGRFEGSIVPEGPSGGQTDGRYALPLAPEAQEYLKSHAIPYDSW
ncbi:MAG: DUF2931 family protein [Halopseudomonas sabulinigri]